MPPHSTENEVASCFEAMGWQVGKAQEDVLAGYGDTEWVGLADDAAHADLVLYTRTGGLPEERALDLWRSCAAAGVPTASLHLDLFYGLGSPKGTLPRHAMPAHDPMFRTEFVFSTDGDHDDLWQRDGVNHHWLPAAIGCSSCWDGERDERWAGYDVAFVGSRSYHPEWPHRERLVGELERRFGDRFVHVSGETFGAAVRSRALHDLYATVPVCIGDAAWVDAHPPTTRYVSDRWYEVWGRGGFAAWPRIDFLEEAFGGYPSWEPWDDFDAMEAAVRWWLAHPEERAEEQQRLTGLVRTRHTFAQRIEAMLTIMGIE